MPKEVIEIDGRDLDGGGYIGVNLNRRTKAIFAELTYHGLIRAWLLQPDPTGRYDIADVINHPNYHMGRQIGFVAFTELES